MTRFRRPRGLLVFALVAGLPLLTTVVVALAQPAAARKAKPPAGTPASQTAAAKFDPIKINGKFFEGWPKPKLAIVITGRLDGYIEPCGCAGLENQKGGLSRRDTFLTELADQGWNLLPIDVGGLVHRFGKQAEIKFGISVEALKMMGYQAVGFGPDDLRLGRRRRRRRGRPERWRQHLRGGQRRPVRFDAHGQSDRGGGATRSALPPCSEINIKKQ